MKKSELIKKLIVFVKPLSGVMTITVILRVLGFIIAAAIPVLGGVGIVSLVDLKIFNISVSLDFVIIGLIVCAVSRGIFRYGEQLSGHYIAFTLLALIRDKIFMAMRRLAFVKLQKKDSGSLLSIITADIELLEVFYAHTIAPAASAVLYFIFALIIFAKIHIVLSLTVALIYIVIGFFLPLLFAKMDDGAGVEYRKKMSSLNSFFLDSLLGIKEIIFFDKIRERKDNIEKRGEAISGTFKLLKNFEGKTFAITEAALSLCNFLMLGLSAFLLVKGKIDFAAFLISNLMLLSGYGPIIAVSGLAVNLQQTFASAERVFSLLEEKPELDEVTDGENLSFEKVDADNINFRYDDMEVLKDVSISVKKDEIVGLCGKSGSGKSTLLRLIMRFFDPLSGEVKMNGIDIKKINTASLREAVSYITQQTYIFKKSIYENILLANRNASKEDVIEAAKKAAIHDFIMNLPEGYDTKMTELGGNLSSGEKQRLGLARAFLHKAPLLLLDEPTGNLDSLNEALILNSIYQEKKDKGVLIVSHRKSTVNAADKIVYIEKGRVR
ncbi:ABC transporter ATP-binding protein [Treponema denticola]|uniref:ABC transporter ATP-binding protein n=1 Tax=Treponema denticola TaxID=158 RepID=UPI0020A59F43|nr:ABC transporter ATP-binding protein [Treponema denticola]UTC86809.1 ABC transporter ATP-binding protein [Treponema denticola]